MAAGRDLAPPTGGASFPYALQTLVDELTMRAGRRARTASRSRSSRSRRRRSRLRRADRARRDDLHAALRAAHVPRELRLRAGELPPVARRRRCWSALRELDRRTGASEIEAAARAALPPSSDTRFVHVVEALGDGRAVRVRAVTRPVERWGLGGGVVSTGAPAAAARAPAGARPDRRARGALPPERCVDPDDLFPELETRG